MGRSKRPPGAPARGVAEQAGRGRLRAGRALCVLVVMVAVGALPAGAVGERASEPGSVAAGGLDTGENHTCALLAGGSVRCWGYGFEGELGYPATRTVGAIDAPSSAGPVDLGAGRTATAISAGRAHTCAILDDANLRCWGFAANGRLGYGTTDNIGDDEPPGAAGPVNLGGAGSAEAVSAGSFHTCAILKDGSVRCWGYGALGQLGYGNTRDAGGTPDSTPDKLGAVNLGGQRATAVSAGDLHTCAILADGGVRCWGYGGLGQLGYGTTTNAGDTPASTPEKLGAVNLGGQRATAISAGDSHTCAILADGSVRCWGFGFSGQLGYGNADNTGDTPANTPDQVGPVNLGGQKATAITAGSAQTCAVLEDRTVRCWGSGADGRLGYANLRNVANTSSSTPDKLGPVDLGMRRTAVAISTGARHTCARLDDGGVRCWGYAGNGRLGYCNETSIGDDETPGAAGPVNLEPGDAGAGCPTPPLTPDTPPTSPSPPSAPGNAPLPLVGDGTAAALAAEKLRASALRFCLTTVSRTATAGSRRARRLSKRARVHATRQVAGRARRGRALCDKRFGRTPGPVSAFRAQATGPGTVTLTFNAAGTDHTRPPAARSYLVKQSRRPIRTPRDFRDAQALCHTRCNFNVTEVGGPISLKITDLNPNRPYYYATSARDNVSRRLGPRSPTAQAKTKAASPSRRRPAP